MKQSFKVPVIKTQGKLELNTKAPIQISERLFYQFSIDISALLPIYISVRKNTYTPKDYKNTKPVKQEKKEQIVLTEESIRLCI